MCSGGAGCDEPVVVAPSAGVVRPRKRNMPAVCGIPVARVLAKDLTTKKLN
jgi:hypothetical protein